jgi:hypothetical protein
VITDAEREKLAAMAAAGARKLDAAARLGMAVDTLRRIIRDEDAVARAWAVGRSELHEQLVSKLIEKAKDGEVVPLLFCLKSIFGYREGEELDAESRPAVVINLPGALDPTAYEKLVGSNRPPVPESVDGDDG